MFKAFAREGNEWVIRSVRGLRKKTEGPREIVSAFEDGRRGFGIALFRGMNSLPCTSFAASKSVQPSRRAQGRAF